MRHNGTRFPPVGICTWLLDNCLFKSFKILRNGSCKSLGHERLGLEHTAIGHLGHRYIDAGLQHGAGHGDTRAHSKRPGSYAGHIVFADYLEFSKRQLP